MKRRERLGLGAGGRGKEINYFLSSQKFFPFDKFVNRFVFDFRQRTFSANEIFALLGWLTKLLNLNN